ncbi:MAG: glycerophosphoryl diester phosphodiesterase [Myxococcota bacterium]|jgi:glycerophosphoryl diester phosphodiesterase
MVLGAEVIRPWQADEPLFVTLVDMTTDPIPRPARFPFLEHAGVLAFAHRGGARFEDDDASVPPENTLAAFQSCVDMGYRYVETDVHLTRDGVLVAFHDDTLDRATDRTGRIADLTWSEVREARVGGSEGIPLFEDVLGTWPELRVNIDPKHDRAVEALTEVIKRTGAIDRVCVGAFSDARLRRVRRLLGPRLCTSLGPIGVTRLKARTVGLPVGSFVQGCAQVPVRQGPITVVDRRFVSGAHRLGLQVHVWTIDDPSEMERLIELGVDGLMTDRPRILRDVLMKHRLWD